MLLMFAGMDDIRICVVVLGSVYVLSPVLKTLTDTISTDTIYAMTVRTGLSRLHCTMNLYERNNVKSGLLCGIQSFFYFLSFIMATIYKIYKLSFTFILGSNAHKFSFILLVF